MRSRGMTTPDRILCTCTYAQYIGMESMFAFFQLSNTLVHELVTSQGDPDNVVSYVCEILGCLYNYALPSLHNSYKLYKKVQNST